MVKDTYDSVQKINGQIKNSDLKSHLPEVSFERALKYLTPKIEYKEFNYETAGIDEYSNTSSFFLNRARNAEQFQVEIINNINSLLDHTNKSLVQSFNTTRNKCEITGRKFIRIIKSEYQNELKLGIKNNNRKLRESEDKIEDLQNIAAKLKKQSTILHINS